VFSFADKAAEGWEADLPILNGNLFPLPIREHDPIADQIDAERALSLRTRHELCA